MHKIALLLLILLLAIGCAQKTDTQTDTASDKIDTKTTQLKEEAKPAEKEKVQVAGITQPQQQLGNAAENETKDEQDDIAIPQLETQLPQINQETVAAPAARPRTSSQATSSSTTNSTETNPDSGDASNSDSGQSPAPEEATVVSTATSGFEVVPE